MIGRKPSLGRTGDEGGYSRAMVGPLATEIIMPQDAALIDSFIAWQAAGAAAPSSMRQRRYILRAFAREHSLLDATEGQIVEYVGRPVRGANGKRTVVSALRIFYAYLCARDICPKNPMALVHQVREERGLPKPVPWLVYPVLMPWVMPSAMGRFIGTRCPVVVVVMVPPLVWVLLLVGVAVVEDGEIVQGVEVVLLERGAPVPFGVHHGVDAGGVPCPEGVHGLVEGDGSAGVGCDAGEPHG